MKLATVQEVLERMNISKTMAGVNTDTIESALEGATAYIESTLRTSLKESTRVDYFSYLPGRYDEPYRLKLWLSQRFVNVSTPIEVYLSETAGVPITDIGTLTAQTSDKYLLASNIGMVSMLTLAQIGQGTVAVKYKAGFKDPDKNVPSWLKEAAIATAIHINHSQTVSHGKKDSKDKSRVLSNIAYSMLNEYIVTPYDGQYSDRTEIVVV